LVWHRRRNTVRAYLRQQIGYGRAESHLRFKHSHRFNGLGQSRWAGRIYGGVMGALGRRRAAIYSGRFGGALFQTLYEPPGSLWRYLPMTFEWNAVALALLIAGAVVKIFGSPVPNLLLLGLALLAISLAHVTLAALRVDVGDLPAWRARPLLAFLCYLGPLVRAVERYTHRFNGYTRNRNSWPNQLTMRGMLDWPRRKICLSYWSETGIEKEECLDVLIRLLREKGCFVEIDDGWQSWDLQIRRGPLGGQIKILVQDHGEKKRQLDAGMSLKKRTAGKLLRCIYAATFVLGIAGGGMPLALAGLTAGLVIEGFLFRESLVIARTFRDTVSSCARTLAVAPLRSASPSAHSNHPGALPSWPGGGDEPRR
jgi:hypothetical protein